MPEQTLYEKTTELQRRIAVYEDELAYKELFFILFPSLTRFSASIVHSRETAEEIVSDVFIKIWADRSRLEEIENIQLYLFIAVRNNSLRKLNQNKRKATVSLDEIDIEIECGLPDPEQSFLSQEALTKIYSAIDLLPPRARLIFKLAKEDRMKYKEIAALLHISVKTVDHQLSLSLKKIATVLGISSHSNQKK